MHALNPSPLEAEAVKSLEVEVILVFRARFRIARTTQRNPALENKQQTNKQK